jgi:hypothetical protein
MFSGGKSAGRGRGRGRGRKPGNHYDPSGYTAHKPGHGEAKGKKRPIGAGFLNVDYTQASQDEQLRLLEGAHEWYNIFLQVFSEQHLAALASSAPERHIPWEIGQAVRTLEAAFRQVSTMWSDVVTALERVRALDTPAAVLVANGLPVTVDQDAESLLCANQIAYGGRHLLEVLRRNYHQICGRDRAMVGLRFDPIYNVFYAQMAALAEAESLTPSSVAFFTVNSDGGSVVRSYHNVDMFEQLVQTRSVIVLFPTQAASEIQRKLSS